MPSESEIRKGICARRSLAVSIEIRSVAFKNGERPEANKCHENVERWVEENPDCVAVRGWLDSGGLLDAHSVIADADGRLFDITRRNPRLLFVRHEDGDGDFFALLPANNQIHCVLCS
jgi:hypothetical protein